MELLFFKKPCTNLIEGKFVLRKYFLTVKIDLSVLKVESRGGKCIPVQCDHSKDEDVAALFERVKAEQNGQLDILVNNAYAAVQVGPFSLSLSLSLSLSHVKNC